MQIGRVAFDRRNSNVIVLGGSVRYSGAQIYRLCAVVPWAGATSFEFRRYILANFDIKLMLFTLRARCKTWNVSEHPQGSWTVTGKPRDPVCLRGAYFFVPCAFRVHFVDFICAYTVLGILVTLPYFLMVISKLWLLQIGSDGSKQ